MNPREVWLLITGFLSGMCGGLLILFIKMVLLERHRRAEVARLARLLRNSSR